MQVQTKLYLKQFMHNYVEAKNHKNILNLLFSSLQVLENMVDQFIQAKNIDNQVLFCREGKSKEEGIGGLEEGLEDGFQRLYGKVKSVLQWADLQCNQKNQSISRHHSSRSFHSHDDDQLYQILNQYKQSNKTLKQQLTSTNTKLQQKTHQLLQHHTKNETLKKQISYLKLHIKQLQQQKQTQQQTIQHQIQNMKNVQQSMNKLQKQVMRCQELVNKKEDQIEELRACIENVETEKVRCERERDNVVRDKVNLELNVKRLKQQFENKIHKKLQQIPEIVARQIKDEKSWNASVVEQLKKFTAYSQSYHKQNVSTNSLLHLQNFKK